MIKAIFWDFDGVIAESVNVKTAAFYEMYLPYGKEIAEKVKQFHLANGGVSRFKKFEYFQSELLGQQKPISDSVINGLAEQFSKLVMEKVINAPYVTGVKDVLEKYSKTLDNYIISGTPTGEMKAIVSARGLDGYFNDILGSPTPKSQLTKELLLSKGYDPKEVIFIGDATSDFKAATENGIHFILRRNEDNEALFRDYDSFYIYDFRNFDEVFNKINSL